MERRLSLRIRFLLRLHLMMCNACTQFSRQLDLLRKAMSEFRRRMEHDSAVRLPEDAYQRISTAMRDRSGQAHAAGQHPDLGGNK